MAQKHQQYGARNGQDRQAFPRLIVRPVEGQTNPPRAEGIRIASNTNLPHTD